MREGETHCDMGRLFISRDIKKFTTQNQAINLQKKRRSTDIAQREQTMMTAAAFLAESKAASLKVLVSLPRLYLENGLIACVPKMYLSQIWIWLCLGYSSFFVRQGMN